MNTMSLNKIVLIHAPQSQLLMHGDDSSSLDVEMHKGYQSVVGNLMYMTNNSQQISEDNGMFHMCPKD